MNADAKIWTAALESEKALRAIAGLDNRLSNLSGIADHLAVMRAAHSAMAQKNCQQKAEIAQLTKMLADCFRMSGADPDGDDDRRLADYALRAVTDLRNDYDDVLDWQDRANKAEALLLDVLASYCASPDLHARIRAHLGAGESA